jgi:hypothetical protein
VQLPFTAWLTATDAAVKLLGAPGAGAAVGGALEALRTPMAVTQEPTATAELVTVLVWVNVVEALKVTATCPVAGSCTWMVLPVMAAASP